MGDCALITPVYLEIALISGAKDGAIKARCKLHRAKSGILLQKTYLEIFWPIQMQAPITEMAKEEKLPEAWMPSRPNRNSPTKREASTPTSVSRPVRQPTSTHSRATMSKIVKVIIVYTSLKIMALPAARRLRGRWQHKSFYTLACHARPCRYRCDSDSGHPCPFYWYA